MTTDTLALMLGVALLVIVILLPYYSIRITGQLTAIRDEVRALHHTTNDVLLKILNRL